MSDATIQAGIQTLLQATDTFADNDVTLGDMRVFNQRGGGPWAIIFPGECEVIRSGDWSQVRYVWEHIVEVWDRFVADSYASIVASRQTVIDTVNANPTLGGLSGISKALVSRSSRPKFLFRQGQSKATKPKFVGFELTVLSTEEVLYDGSGEFTT